MEIDLVFAAVPPQVFGWVGLAVGLGLILLGLRAGRRKRLVDNIPTSKTTGVFIGFVEVKGSAESERPFRSHLAEAVCVWYSWDVQERWQRTVTEHYTDSDGKRRTRTKTESGWRTVASGGEQELFYLRDDCGVIRINPDRAKIEGETVFSQTVGRHDPLYFAKGPPDEIMNSDHRRRFVERAIPLDPATRMGTYAGAALGLVGAWLLGWVWMAYNSMIDLKHRVGQAWSNVDVQLKRRHDLIPSLVECLKGLAEHERSVLEDIAFLRSQAGATAPGQQGADPQPCAAKLVALRETYPRLNSNDNFLKLQKGLCETENRIALARGYFNEIVSHYNTRLQIVPDRFIAAIASLKPRQFITAENFERRAVRVSLVD